MTRTDRTPDSRAFSLLEVMIVISILGVVMGFTVIALNSAGDETAMSTAEGALQMNANDFAMRLASELRTASRTAGGGVSINATGTEISFRVPVDVDQNGSADLDGSGSAVFGATYGRTHTAGADIAYRFRANKIGGADEAIDEGAIGFDVNGDGDDADSFTRGLFTRTAPDASGADVALAASDRWFLLGDEDGDGVEEPIFDDGADGTIIIRLLAADVLERRKAPVRALVTTSVLPLNP